MSSDPILMTNIYEKASILIDLKGCKIIFFDIDRFYTSVVPRMFDVQVLTKSYMNAPFSENAKNGTLHVTDEKSDIRDRKPIPWATF